MEGELDNSIETNRTASIETLEIAEYFLLIGIEEKMITLSKMRTSRLKFHF